MRKIICILCFLILISGCIEEDVKEKTEEESLAVAVCVRACEDALLQDQNMSDGPCLLNPIQNMTWVCDVAHSPRKDVDNLKANQCSAWIKAYKNREVMHFIELNESCSLIRVV